MMPDSNGLSLHDLFRNFKKNDFRVFWIKETIVTSLKNNHWPKADNLDLCDRH